MATYVAFLRAINLGATRKFPKAAIVGATEAAGFSDVATHINTGNIRFETRMRSRARIEEALEKSFLEDRGFEVPTIAFTATELCGVVEDADRFGADHEGRHYVSLLKEKPSAAAAKTLEAKAGKGERVHVADRAVHLLVGESYLGAQLTNSDVEKLLGVATNRNVTVLRAITKKWC